jgi:hypothetical protein
MGEKVITGLLDFPKSGNHDDSKKYRITCNILKAGARGVGADPIRLPLTASL